MAAARRSSRGAPIPLAIEQLLRGACHINSPAGGTNTSCRARAMAGRRLLRPGEQVGLIQRASRARQPRFRPAHSCRSINREGTVQLQQSCSGATGKAKEEWRAWRKLGRRRTPWMAGAPSSRPSMQVLCPSDVLPVAPPIPTRHRAALIQCSPGARVRAAASEQAWSRSRHGRQPFAAQQSK